MLIKDLSVQFRLVPELANFLVRLDKELYQEVYGTHLTITSGSEPETVHSETSLHYAGSAVDIRTNKGLNPKLPEPRQHYIDVVAAKDAYCKANDIPTNWIDVVWEKDHFHIEYQPKRRRS